MIVDKVELQLVYNDIIKGYLKVTIEGIECNLFNIDISIEDYEDLKELCKDNPYKYLKDDRFSKLANFKIRHDIKEVLIVNKTSSSNFSGMVYAVGSGNSSGWLSLPYTTTEPKRNKSLGEIFKYNPDTDKLECNLPIEYTFKKNFWIYIKELFL